MAGSNSSGTLGPRHSKAYPFGWAYNRVATVKSQVVIRVRFVNTQHNPHTVECQI